MSTHSNKSSDSMNGSNNNNLNHTGGRRRSSLQRPRELLYEDGNTEGQDNSGVEDVLAKLREENARFREREAAVKLTPPTTSTAPLPPNTIATATATATNSAFAEMTEMERRLMDDAEQKHRNRMLNSLIDTPSCSRSINGIPTSGDDNNDTISPNILQDLLAKASATESRQSAMVRRTVASSSSPAAAAAHSLRELEDQVIKSSVGPRGPHSHSTLDIRELEQEVIKSAARSTVLSVTTTGMEDLFDLEQGLLQKSEILSGRPHPTQPLTLTSSGRKHAPRPDTGRQGAWAVRGISTPEDDPLRVEDQEVENAISVCNPPESIAHESTPTAQPVETGGELVSAWSVSHPEELPQAIPDHGLEKPQPVTNSEPKFCRMSFTLFASLLLLAVIGISTVSLLLRSPSSGSNNNDQQQSYSRTSSPQPSPQYELLRGVVLGQFGYDYFDNNPSRQKALDWIVYQDPLQLATTTNLTIDIPRLVQRFVLVAMYYQTSSETEPWLYCNPDPHTESCMYQRHYQNDYLNLEEPSIRWLSGAHECSWMGITCSKEARDVQWIDLYWNNLGGTVPTELQQLSKLDTLQLGRNHLSGSLSPWLMDMPALTKLQLIGNDLTGTLPPGYFTKTNMEFLDTRDNLLTGTIPSEIGLFSGESLFLDRNKLTGSIPDEFYSLTKLRKVHLGSNMLSGTLSTMIGAMESLELFYLDGFNSMGSTLPTELGLLQNLQLLDVTDSNLRGPIPDELFHLPYLNSLYLSENELSGTIGSGLGLLTELVELKMSNNKFTGAIPSELSHLTQMLKLEINGNPYLTGSMPEEFCEMRNNKAETVADCLPKAETGIPILSCPSTCCTTCL